MCQHIFMHEEGGEVGNHHPLLVKELSLLNGRKPLNVFFH